MIEALSHGNFLDLMTMDYGFCERAAECGLRSFIIMAGALDCLSVKPTFMKDLLVLAMVLLDLRLEKKIQHVILVNR